MAALARARATSPRTPPARASLRSRASPRGVPRPRRTSRTTTSATSSSDYDDALLAAELESLVEDTRVAGGDAHTHVVAFSGGVDSSLCAYLVHRAFGGDVTDDDGGVRARAYAAVGTSPSLPASQLATARGVAEAIGIPLREVSTDEGAVPEYVANEGESCLHCKDELYATLRPSRSTPNERNRETLRWPEIALDRRRSNRRSTRRPRVCFCTTART